MNTTTTNPRTALRELEEMLGTARDQRVFEKRSFEEARDAWARTGKGFQAAERAKADLRDRDAEIEALRGKQRELLRQVSRGGLAGGNGNDPRSGEPFGLGWQRVAHGIDVPVGHNRVDLPLADLMRRTEPMAGISVTPEGGWTAPAIIAPFIPEARDERHIWTAFPAQPVEPDELAITDFRQTGNRTVTGEVERDPLSTATKAKLSLEVKLATPTLKQFAVIVEEVPLKLLEVIELFGQFLANELDFQVDLALDAHCLTEITEAKPAKGEEGESLWIKVRNAVKAMRAKGAKPNVLALNPDDAAALDTLTAGVDHLPVFALRDVGSSSPLFGLSIIEVPNLEAPTLLDTSIAGVLYLGMARFLADPYTGLDTNEVRLRLEAEALLHIRDAAGLYVIGEAPEE